MNTKTDNAKLEVWKDVINEVNLKAGKEVLAPNETNIELIKEKAIKHMVKLSMDQLEEDREKPLIGFDEDGDIDFDSNTDV